MSESIPQLCRGGLISLPLLHTKSRNSPWRLAVAAFSVVTVFACLPIGAQQPNARQLENIRRARRQTAAAPNRPRPAQMREAQRLMRLMLKPTQPYVGVQETQIYGGSSAISKQEVEGDTNGFVRITFRSPASVEGDVMIIKPGSFHSYHKASRTLEVAPWPTEWNDEGKRMFANLINGTVNAWVNGRETIAERSAAIVVLTVPNGALGAGRILRKLWIDEQTGILLKIQKLNAEGQTTSTTTMESITVNPTTPISPSEFQPQFQGATITPLFPEPQYRTMLEAQGKLPFTPLQPQYVPENFHLDGVWGFGEDRTHPYLHSVLLRYTDGVASFSLYERLVPPANQTPVERPPRQMFMRNQQNWRLMSPQGEVNVQYIGHLGWQQARALYESLR